MEEINPKIKIKMKFRPNLNDNIIIAQQSLPQIKTPTFYPFVDVSKKFEESLEKCRKKQKHAMKIKAIEQVTISKHLSENIIESYRKSQNKTSLTKIRERRSSETNELVCMRNNRRASELVDQLLLDIYGRGHNAKIYETEYASSTSFRSFYDKYDEKLQYTRLISKNVTELRILINSLKERVNYSGNALIKQLKKRDALKSKQEKICNIITAHLHAYSGKTSEDTNMRFSPTPIPGDSGFNQWRDAMKMVAKLPGGIPPEFRKKLWIALADKHLQSKGVNWAQTEKLCFNEWSNPDDSELGIQIVKDLHRTGCSLFCGTAGQENQALLKRVLLAYARWNKSVGYCQGFNMLAALILQVMDKSETDSVKVMIYLIEGVLPESYFANNLRGLSVDMIVFRDLLKLRLPQLSKHLETLQNGAREGNSYEPPLTNVFTMQWFLTLFCNCLPQPTVLRVWDLIFLEGNEILLRTAIAIWQKLSDRILAVNSADEFYSIMGVLTREMLEFGVVDSNTLIKSIVAIGSCSELNEMRDKYLYNITPWTQSVQSAAKKGFKMFYSDDDDMDSDYDEKAAVTAAYGISVGRRKDKLSSNSSNSSIIQPYAHGHPDRERLALDISALKKQYAKLRERQRQAHIILQAACAKQPISQNSSPQPITLNHLLLGKNAIVNSRGRRLGPLKGSIPPARTKEPAKHKQEGETILWKDTAKVRFPRRPSCTEETKEKCTTDDDSSSSYSEDDASSSSTELCDEPDRISDFDSEDKNLEVSSKNYVETIDFNSLESSEDLPHLDMDLKLEEIVTQDISFKEDFDIRNPLDFTQPIEDTNVEQSENFLPKSPDDINVPIEKFSLKKLKETLEEAKVSSNITEDTNSREISSEQKVACEDLSYSSSDIFKTNDDFEETNENINSQISVNFKYDFYKDFTNEEISYDDYIVGVTTNTVDTKFEASQRPNLEDNEITKNYVDINSQIEEPKATDLLYFEDFGNESTEIKANIEFESFLEERIQIMKENSSDSLSSPKEESTTWKSTEDRLRRYKSCEESSKNHMEKAVVFKQNSFDIGSLPTIETSLWKPLEIEEESSKDIEDVSKTEPKKNLKKQTTIDLLSVEDKRLEAGRRNSERALKIIQENSLILHRILQQQKSSEKEDSEDELSRSPISRTFLRSESLLSKDEKTDEERSSKDGDEELESGVESFSVSPALIDEESDRCSRKDQLDQEEILVVSKNEDFESSYKFNNTNNDLMTEISTTDEDTREQSSRRDQDILVVSKDTEFSYKFDRTDENDLVTKISTIDDDTSDQSSIKDKLHEEQISVVPKDEDIEFPYHFEKADKYNIMTKISSLDEDISFSKSSIELEKKFDEDKYIFDENYISFLHKNKEDSLDENHLPNDKQKVISFLERPLEFESKTDCCTFEDKTLEKYDTQDYYHLHHSRNKQTDDDDDDDSSLNYQIKGDVKVTKYSKDITNLKDEADLPKFSYISPCEHLDENEEMTFCTDSNRFNVQTPVEDELSFPRKEFDSEYSTILSPIDYKTDVKDLEDEINSGVNISQTSDKSFEVRNEYIVAASNFMKFDNNLLENHQSSAQKTSSSYTYNRKNLSIDLKQNQFGDYSPEISPPKNLSCLQFTTFQADIPCTSKSIQLTPICAKDKTLSPSSSSPSKSPKYLSSFNLPTLSPPRRSVKSPFSPDRTFNPFPVQPTTRQPKEVGVRLGLYKNLSPQKSPTK